MFDFRAISRTGLSIEPKVMEGAGGIEIMIEVVARVCSFMLDGGRSAALKRRGGIGMANKKKKAVAKASSKTKKAAPS
ncbi:MAG: hypothetical protein OEV01_14310, partial [Nitrospira sp.]|nr:hypothetical protein [Nitrospira sp.]